ASLVIRDLSVPTSLKHVSIRRGWTVLRTGSVSHGPDRPTPATLLIKPIKNSTTRNDRLTSSYERATFLQAEIDRINDLTIMGTGNWIGMLSTVLIIICFYFTLTFFQHLRLNDERVVNQSKLAAVICLALGLLLPVLYGFYMYNQMMR